VIAWDLAARRSGGDVLSPRRAASGGGGGAAAAAAAAAVAPEGCDGEEEGACLDHAWWMKLTDDGCRRATVVASEALPGGRLRVATYVVDAHPEGMVGAALMTVTSESWLVAPPGVTLARNTPSLGAAPGG